MAELIAGKYRVTRKLDSGGMADVFLARVEGAAGFARTVVIKRLAPALAREPDVVTMFLDEARIAARLHHSNIAQVFDFGTDASGYYLAMEFLAGRDALDLVRAAHPGALPLAAAVAIVMGAAAGLHHAHEQRDDAGRPLGIVHRDVTSANVFVTVDGAVKVIDFGIARAADRSTVTRTGMVKGTTAYLSPEQASAAPVDRRSDLFQLGVVLYELVTGVRPFDQRGDNDLVIANKIAAGVYTPARARRPECPPDLDALIGRLLAVDPARRPPTGEAVIVELDALARRYGWSTSPHELARVVRELFPVPAGGETPDTAVDGAGVATDTPTATVTPQGRAPAGAGGDRAAILADLEAPARRTLADDARGAPPTVRGKTPAAAARGAAAGAASSPVAGAPPGPPPQGPAPVASARGASPSYPPPHGAPHAAATVPQPPRPAPSYGIPTVDGPAPAPSSIAPRVVVGPAPTAAVPGGAAGPAPASPGGRRVAPTVIVTVSLLAGGVLLVFAIVTLLRGSHPRVVADARTEIETTTTQPTTADTTGTTTTGTTTATADDAGRADARPDGSVAGAARCLDDAEDAIRAVTDGLAAGEKIRTIRETWEHGRACVGQGVGPEYDKCREARLDPRHDAARTVLDDLGVKIKTVEAGKQLEYGYLDDTGVAMYRDFAGDWLTTEQVDAK